jgi:hypothetical protein
VGVLVYHYFVKLTLPIPDKISLNAIYAGVHFRTRTSHKQKYHNAVWSANPKPYTGIFPVHMEYHFRLHGRALDVSNHAYMLKMVEDALVHAGVIPDDTPKYVASITITAEKSKADEVDVQITPLHA